MSQEPEIGGKRPVVGPLEPGEYWWCTCGRSQTQPYCDGSHAGSGFSPQRFEISETKVCALCTCKRTQNGPFCDGAHSKL